jgi:hypothetical protein
MSDTKQTTRNKTRLVVGQLLKAVDRVLDASEEVKKARSALTKEVRRQESKQR